MQFFLLAACCDADSVKISDDAAAREQLSKVVEVLVADKVSNFDDCIAWARLKFQVTLAAELRSCLCASS